MVGPVSIEAAVPVAHVDRSRVTIRQTQGARYCRPHW